MEFSKSLLLKGLAASAAIAGGGVAIAKRQNIANYFKSQEQVDRERKQKVEEVNGKLKTLGLGEEYCALATTDFPNHKDSDNYSKNCTLDQAKFKKIKFSNAGDTDVEVEGWNSNNTVKLTISNKSDEGIKFLFREVKDDLTITKSSSEKESKITIRKERETEFEIKDDKLSKVVDAQLKTKLEKVNEKLVTLGLTDESCRFDVTEEDKTLECGLDGDKLKAIKFSNKGSAESLTVTGEVGKDLKIKVEVEDKEEDATFSFTGLTQDLTLYGDKTKGKIVLKKEGDRTFKEKGGKLEKVSQDPALSAKLKKFNKQLSTLSLPDQCRFDVAEKDKVLECGLDADMLKKINFSNKGTPDLTLSGEIQGTLKIKVEAKDNENDATFSFTGLSQDLIIYGDKKANIVLKSSSATPARTFKEKGGKLEKVPQDATKVEKLKKINKQLEDLKIQDKCRFDENDDDSSIECQLTLEDFKKIELTSKDGNDLTVTTGSDLSKMKLKVEMKTESDEEDESKANYTISDLDKKIKFGKTGEEIVLETDKSYGFEVREGKLGPMRKVKTIDRGDAVITLFSYACTYDGNSNKGKCKSPLGFMEMIFDENGSEVTESITWTDKAKHEIFDFWEYQENYNEGIKFTYRGETYTTKNSKQTDRKLEKNKNYEMKKTNDGKWKIKQKP